MHDRAVATTRACAISLRGDETGPVACLPLRLSKPCDTVVTIPALAVLRRAGRRAHPGLFRFTAPRRFNPACAEPWRLPDRSRSPAAHGDDSRLRYAVRRDGPSQAYAVPTRLPWPAEPNAARLPKPGNTTAARRWSSSPIPANRRNETQRDKAGHANPRRLSIPPRGDETGRPSATRLPKQRPAVPLPGQYLKVGAWRANQ